MHSVRKPWWQQATALVTVSTGGVITGFTFVPGAAASMTSPSSVPLHLLALEKAAKPADTGDDRLRPAIVNVAGYYLQLAQTRTPAQMEALIWGKDSVDGADHGPSCAAFASLTLELAAQAVGQQSWVSGGATYPWPLHEWADVRVNPNPDSLGVTSIVQDAQAHQRWHPLGDGYQPQPGDWVVFDGHVEVVTSSANGALDTIGADSLPNLTVNAHSFPDPLAQQGVEGFVDNGHLGETTAASSGAPAAAPGPATGAGTSRGTRSSAQPQLAAIPGVVAPASSSGTGPTGSSTAGAGAPGGAATGTAAPSAPAQSTSGGATAQAKADIPGAAVAAGLAGAAPHPSGTGTATPPTHSRTSAPYRQHAAPAAATPGTKSQQAFINQIAPGALAAQQRFGVPASVTIAQAIDESGWGTSQLAANDYNLFGIKGSGPAGSVTFPTQEFENGQWVTIYAQFRVYHNVSESISDHAELLATSGYYTRAMADRAVPDAFANDLTGVYATDPEYGANLIALMRLYNLYRFDSPTASQAQAAAPSHTPAAHSPAGHPSGSAGSAAQPSIPGILSALSPALAGTPTPSATHSPTTQPSGTHPSAAQPSGPQASIPGILSVLAPAQAGTPTPSATQTPTAQPSATETPAPQPTHVQPSATQPSTAQPSGSELSGAQASIPGILSALAPAQAGTPTPNATQTPAAQPAASQASAQPAIAQPSAAQPSGSPAVGQPAVRDPAVGDPAVAGSADGVAAVGRSGLGTAAVGGAGVGSWHDVRALTSARRNPDAQRHAAADGHCVTGRGAWHIRRGLGPRRHCDAGERCRRAGRLLAAGKRGDPRRFRRAPRQRGGVRARRRSGSRYRRCDVDELREPVELVRRPRQLRGGQSGYGGCSGHRPERPGELPAAGEHWGLREHRGVRELRPALRELPRGRSGRGGCCGDRRDCSGDSRAAGEHHGIRERGGVRESRGHRARRSRGSGQRRRCPGGTGAAGEQHPVRGHCGVCELPADRARGRRSSGRRCRCVWVRSRGGRRSGARCSGPAQHRRGDRPAGSQARRRFPGPGRRPGPGVVAPRRDPVRDTAAVDRRHRVFRQGQGASRPCRTTAPRRRWPGGDPLAAARRVRLDAVPRGPHALPC